MKVFYVGGPNTREDYHIEVGEEVGQSIVTSWHGNPCRITGPLYGESIGYRWIPLTKGQWCDDLMFLWY